MNQSIGHFLPPAGLVKLHGDDRISSFSSDFILKQIGYDGKWEDILDCTPVECLTVGSLLSKTGFESVDIIQIDAEGYDYEIVKSIDFDKLRPDIVCFEFLTLSESDRAECLRFMVKNGYRWAREGRDLFAVHQDCKLNVVQ